MVGCDTVAIRMPGFSAHSRVESLKDNILLHVCIPHFEQGVVELLKTSNEGRMFHHGQATPEVIESYLSETDAAAQEVRTVLENRDSTIGIGMLRLE